VPGWCCSASSRAAFSAGGGGDAGIAGRCDG
jgi:hypothetical protein